MDNVLKIKMVEKRALGKMLAALCEFDVRSFSGSLNGNYAEVEFTFNSPQEKEAALARPNGLNLIF